MVALADFSGASVWRLVRIEPAPGRKKRGRVFKLLRMIYEVDLLLFQLMGKKAFPDSTEIQFKMVE